MRRALLYAGLLALSACASRAPAPVGEAAPPSRIEPPLKASTPAAAAGGHYTVKKGDTLYGIAREHGLNPRDLAAWNNLPPDHRVTVGQQLRLSPPEKTAKEAETVEVRPIAAAGSVIARPLEGGPANAVPPAPTLAPPASGETLKRTPKGGKLPYSEENLARLKAQEGAPAALAAAPAAAEKPAEKPVEKPADKPSDKPAAASIEWSWPASGKLLATFNEGGTGAQELSRGIDIAGKLGEPVQAAAAGKVIYVGRMNKYGNLVILLHGEGLSSVYAHNSKIVVKEGQQVARGQKIAELGDSDANEPKLHFEIRQQGKPVDPLKFLPPR
ncbi:MAG: peptidoglycan DD-metalloendopeptidase family protein [Rhodocyclaceae bacterium]|nr:peptidoglycan DD-metalloendopeptidase family protein [Rhodocyclaceae bacterium]